MTNDIHIDRKTLKEDKKLIILQLLVEECERLGIYKIRYSDLRRECDERLNSLTEGHQSAFGGSFDKFINDLEDKRLLERSKQSPKRTYIIPNIPKIKDFLQSKAIVGSFNNMHLVEAELDRTLLENAAKQSHMNMRNEIEKGKFSDKRYNDFMLQAESEFHAVLMSHDWRLYYASPKVSTFNIPQGFISELLKWGYIIAIRNDKKLIQPFKIILEYRGLNAVHQESPTINSLYAKKYCEWFVKWARIFHKYEITEEDKNKILKVVPYTSLSEKTQTLFREFTDEIDLEWCSILSKCMFSIYG